MGKKHQDWKTESEAKTILTKLGIYDFDEGCDHLSGGQKKRVALARTLVDPTEVLILDEPTNHLDNDMVLWLEEFLNSFRGVLIMVTHDRYFLDRVTNKIVEIDKGKLYEYDTNYSGFVELKVQREEMELATERKRQSLLRVEMEWMKKNGESIYGCGISKLESRIGEDIPRKVTSFMLMFMRHRLEHFRCMESARISWNLLHILLTAVR